MKQRGGVRRDVRPLFLAGQMPPRRHWFSGNPKQLVAVQHFCRLVREEGETPKCMWLMCGRHTCRRTENSARLTLDRMVRSEPEPKARLSTQMGDPIWAWGKAVVLELKFTSRYPNWFRDLVRRFDLRQCGAAKYADGVA